MIDRTVQNKDVRLHYLVTEPDDAQRPSLIFLPGLTANAHSVAGLIAAGLGDAFRVVSLDFRARGLSDIPETGYTMADYVGDAVALLDERRLDGAFVVGHSFGGLIAMLLAADYPERVARLVLADSSHLLVTEETAVLIKSSLDRLGRPFTSRETYLETMQQMPWLQGYWGDDIEAYFCGDVETLPDGRVRPWTPAAAIAQTIDAEFTVNWASAVRRLSTPTLLLRAPEPYGAAPLLAETMARQTVELIPNCDYAETSGNHITMLFGEHAAKTAQILADWLPQGENHAR